MMKEFTPPGLCLLGPSSNGLALFYYAKKCDYMYLQCSNDSETCYINSRMPKNSCVDSLCPKFGKKLIELSSPLVPPLLVLKNPQNMSPKPQISPKKH